MCMGKILGKESLTLILIIILGTCLRLVNIDQSLWLDEAAQAVLSSKSLSFIWFGRSGDFHPPLFYMLSHYWLSVGQSEIWLRLLPLSFGVINIPILYKIAKELLKNMSKHAGIIAALLLAIAPFHIYYSQEFRSYSLLCLLVSLSMYAMLKKKYLALSIINALIMYTHYAGIFMILCQFLYQIAYERKNLRNYILSLVISFLLFTPWLPQFTKQLSSGVNISEYLPGWKDVLSISPVKALPTIVFKLVAGRINLMPKWIYGLYVVSVLCITFSAALISTANRRLLTLWMFGPIALIIITSLLLPQSQPFRVIYVLPAFILVFTSAVIKFPKLFMTLLLYISIVGNLLYFTRPRLQREQWRQAGEFLARQNTTTVIKFPEAFAPLQWYQPSLDVVGAVKFFPGKYSDIELEIDKIDKSTRRILVMQYLSDLTDPAENVEKVLGLKGFSQTKIINFEGVGFIMQYDKSE